MSTTDDDMALPAGKSCCDCAHFKRCRALIGAKHINEAATRCDFAPSRFRLRQPEALKARSPS